jgi:uncharacterized FAD-dependent dehydrogenase
MLRINDLKIPHHEGEDFLLKKLAKELKVKIDDLNNIKIVKESIDARDKMNVLKAYSIEFNYHDEEKLLKYNKSLQSFIKKDLSMEHKKGVNKLNYRPIIVGSGPAGLFAAYMLSVNGFKPIILERGEDLPKRDEDVNLFWNEGILNKESNVQFGLGGAGTYSDGKLTTRIKDENIDLVLETLVKHGGPRDIIYKNKPHIGTDLLKTVVSSMKDEIIKYGGEFRFSTKLINIKTNEDKYIVTTTGGELDTQVIVLAIGNSSRDTFELLDDLGFSMEAKPFAIGVRVEHKQTLIDNNQYGDMNLVRSLGHAEYKLTHKSIIGRSVYSFCMCPGGEVIGASSEEGMLCVNGMSYHDRSSQNSNSAILVGIDPIDFQVVGPLGGMHLQRDIEKKAFILGGSNYRAPVQTLGSYLYQKNNEIGDIKPSYRLGYKLADISTIFPDYINVSLREAFLNFERKIKGFSNDDVIITGVETRSSSPLRIIRNEFDYQSVSHKGIYPCGEGAGYAGGITSSAVDGLRIAKKIISEFEY